MRDPQNPVAINNEYFGSRFHEVDKIEKTPKMKLPIILITNIFTENVSKTTGVDAILYLRKVPAIAPIANKIISIPLIYFHLPILSFDRHYQHSICIRSGFGLFQG